MGDYIKYTNHPTERSALSMLISTRAIHKKKKANLADFLLKLYRARPLIR